MERMTGRVFTREFRLEGVNLVKERGCNKDRDGPRAVNIGAVVDLLRVHAV